MVSIWLDSIQLRVPGASIIIVATHIDCATTQSELDRQCQFVQGLVKEKMMQFKQQESSIGIPSLTVWNGGESCRVNCVEGVGVDELKKNLIKMAHSLPWWRPV